MDLAQAAMTNPWFYDPTEDSVLWWERIAPITSMDEVRFWRVVPGIILMSLPSLFSGILPTRCVTAAEGERERERAREILLNPHPRAMPFGSYIPWWEPIPPIGTIEEV